MMMMKRATFTFSKDYYDNWQVDNKERQHKVVKKLSDFLAELLFTKLSLLQ